MSKKSTPVNTANQAGMEDIVTALIMLRREVDKYISDEQGMTDKGRNAFTSVRALLSVLIETMERAIKEWDSARRREMAERKKEADNGR